MLPHDRRTFLGLSLALAALPSSQALGQLTPIRIGAMLPDTGPAARTGGAEQRGIAFALKQAQGSIRGRQVSLHVENFPATSQPLLRAFNILAHANATIAIIAGYPGPVIGLAPLASKYRVVLVNAGNQTDQLANVSPYLINTIPPVRDEIGVLVPFVTGDLKLKHAAVLYTDDAVGLAARGDFVGAFEAAGGKITHQEKVSAGTTDFSPALSALVVAKPPLLFTGIAEGGRSLALQMRGLGLTMPVVGTSSLADPATILEPAANGWYHTQVPSPKPAQLTAEFKRAFPAEPFAFYTRQYYYATAMILAALEKLTAEKRAISGKTLRAAILETRHFPGIPPLDSKGNATAPEIEIVRFENGKDKIVKRVKRDAG
ncbi:MAG: ABC transporter substrate-binding protein [Acetobacteraceae bacterium]